MKIFNLKYILIDYKNRFRNKIINQKATYNKNSKNYSINQNLVYNNKNKLIMKRE